MRVLTGGVAVLATALVATAYGSVNASKPGAYRLVARQAQDIAVSMRFVNAFNGHSLSQTLATFSPNALGSDCDYRRIQVVTFTGRRQIAAWLRRRFADDDHLRVARVLNDNPSQPVGVLAVDWARRTSRTLRQLGFARGIVPKVSAKVVLTHEARPKIRVFSNGPVGGDPGLCRPK